MVKRQGKLSGQPVSSKWMTCVKTIGSLYRDTYNLLKQRFGVTGAAALTRMMYQKGLRAAPRFVKELRLKRDLEGAAAALLNLEATYGIKSRIVKKEQGRIVIHCTDCPWSRLDGWSQELCASIDSYERGLVKGIAGARQFVTKRRSAGAKVCEIILQLDQKMNPSLAKAKKKSDKCWIIKKMHQSKEMHQSVVKDEL